MIIFISINIISTMCWYHYYSDPDVCREPMISRTKRLFLSADPDEVSQGFLAQIWGQRAKEPAALFSHQYPSVVVWFGREIDPLCVSF